MIVTVFRSKAKPELKPEVLARLEKVGARMAELATAQPGFVSYKDFAAADGESVTVVEFDTLANVAAWREHPEHKAAQEWARAEVLTEYVVHVCEVVRTARFPR
jgi:heme-degrading monooxygenase HmoA